MLLAFQGVSDCYLSLHVMFLTMPTLALQFVSAVPYYI